MLIVRFNNSLNFIFFDVIQLPARAQMVPSHLTLNVPPALNFPMIRLNNANQSVVVVSDDSDSGDKARKNAFATRSGDKNTTPLDGEQKRAPHEIEQVSTKSADTEQPAEAQNADDVQQKIASTSSNKDVQQAIVVNETTDDREHHLEQPLSNLKTRLEDVIAASAAETAKTATVNKENDDKLQHEITGSTSFGEHNQSLNKEAELAMARIPSRGTDGEHLDQQQSTSLKTDIIKEHSTSEQKSATATELLTPALASVGELEPNQQAPMVIDRNNSFSRNSESEENNLLALANVAEKESARESKLPKNSGKRKRLANVAKKESARGKNLVQRKRLANIAEKASARDSKPTKNVVKRKRKLKAVKKSSPQMHHKPLTVAVVEQEKSHSNPQTSGQKGEKQIENVQQSDPVVHSHEFTPTAGDNANENPMQIVQTEHPKEGSGDQPEHQGEKNHSPSQDNTPNKDDQMPEANKENSKPGQKKSYLELFAGNKGNSDNSKETESDYSLTLEICKVCHRRFRTKEILENHMAIHFHQKRMHKAMGTGKKKEHGKIAKIPEFRQKNKHFIFSMNLLFTVEKTKLSG